MSSKLKLVLGAMGFGRQRLVENSAVRCRLKLAACLISVGTDHFVADTRDH